MAAGWAPTPPATVWLTVSLRKKDLNSVEDEGKDIEEGRESQLRDMPIKIYGLKIMYLLFLLINRVYRAVKKCTGLLLSLRSGLILLDQLMESQSLSF